MLRNRAEYAAALVEVERLAGCLEGSFEEGELIRLALDVEIYEVRHRIE